MQNILIVEDEKKISDVLQLYIENDGFSAQVIADGAEVVDWVKTHEPALILLDINLPNKNGLDICKEVRTFSNVLSLW